MWIYITSLNYARQATINVSQIPKASYEKKNVYIPIHQNMTD